MGLDRETIFDAALSLPEEDRAALASLLWETVPDGAASISFQDLDFWDEMDRRFADRDGSVPRAELQSEW